MAAPSFENVPDHWKYPFGPYRQAPPEYGARWYMVNPFTGAEPWLNDEKVAKPLPPGFLEIFRARPTSDQFHNVPNGMEAFRVARNRWDQDRKHFKQAGVPPGVDPAELKSASAVFKFWGMGEPKFYEGRYGWKARFPESQIYNFEANLDGVFVGPHVLIAQYQIRLLEFGIYRRALRLATVMPMDDIVLRSSA